LNDLAKIKQLNPHDLHSFLQEDHTSYSVLSVSAKHIPSTSRLSITLSKNSASSFYLGVSSNSSSSQPISSASTVSDDCLTDAQHCFYFSLFNSKEKKLYTRFLDKVETDFEGVQYLSEPSSLGSSSDIEANSNLTSSEPIFSASFDPQAPNQPSQDEPNHDKPKDTPSQPTEPGSDKPKQHLNSLLKNPPLRLVKGTRSPLVSRLDTRPLLFITLTFNTTNQDYHA
jgi:hypothetical protein